MTSTGLTELETRLQAALLEHTNHLELSDDAWEENQARLAPTRGARRLRAPLLVAAAVLAITASVTTFAVVNRPTPAGTAVSTADCSFAQNMPGSLGSASVAAPRTGALISIDADTSGRSCFFDGIAWHAAAAGTGRIKSLGTSTTADGRSWLWTVISAGDDTAGNNKVVLVDEQGRPLPATPIIDRSFFGGPDGLRFVVASVSGNGSVQYESKDGKPLGETSFDVSTGYQSTGPVLTPAPDPTPGNSTWTGAPLECPVGQAEVSTQQRVPDGSSVEIQLHERGAAGEDAICLQSAEPAVALVPGAGHSSYAITRLPNGSNLLWGVVGDEAARVNLILGENTEVSFGAGPAQPGTTAMATLGPYRVYAVVIPSNDSGFSFSILGADGRSLPQTPPRR